MNDDNYLYICLSVFIILTSIVWYYHHKHDDVDNDETQFMVIGERRINIFGVFVITMAIFVYYIYATINYTF